MGDAVWKNYATNRCRIFIWLAHRDRLATNDRHFLTSALFAITWRRLLQTIHPAAPSCFRIADLWEFSRNDKVRSTVLISLLWNIWKRKNAMAFNQELEDLHTMVLRCANKLHLWASRCSTAARRLLEGF
ncbi:hypothetical protein BRADI_5g03628v3 [Brachypodium distachyon]|uniref:Reverse transcriptase zinc-binding domain-containing protein n=1 Tax=Brachypodium distachyon TaxID=15368 RepID=A0A2K2CFB1_BRADI|nr:hypothetical protein BRADI_5g03628v3 [Brachypodium distachyon]